MTPPVVELSKADARKKAVAFFVMAAKQTSKGQELLLAALLQQVYQEGVTAGLNEGREERP